MTQMDRLRAMARLATDEYDAETMAGGEPTYPQWAADILSACERVEASLPRDISVPNRKSTRHPSF